MSWQELFASSDMEEDIFAARPYLTDVKRICCDKLLAQRVEQKLASRRAGEVGPCTTDSPTLSAQHKSHVELCTL